MNAEAHRSCTLKNSIHCLDFPIKASQGGKKYRIHVVDYETQSMTQRGWTIKQRDQSPPSTHPALRFVESGLRAWADDFYDSAVQYIKLEWPEYFPSLERPPLKAFGLLGLLHVSVTARQGSPCGTVRILVPNTHHCGDSL